jgi:hypothetical protein
MVEDEDYRNVSNVVEKEIEDSLPEHLRKSQRKNRL